MRPKKVKLSEHDKLLKKFRHKEALVSVLSGKNPENVVAVMEEMVARRKLLKCVVNLDEEELGLLLGFLHKHSTMPRHSGLLMGLTKKVLEMRADDIRASDALKSHIRNLKRSVEEEIRIQHSLQEIQGIISPLLRIAGRR
jgi:U3 small nucleolar RNA-associated protein 15